MLSHCWTHSEAAVKAPSQSVLIDHTCGYYVKIDLNFKGSLTTLLSGLFENSNESSVRIVTLLKNLTWQSVIKIREQFWVDPGRIDMLILGKGLTINILQSVWRGYRLSAWSGNCLFRFQLMINILQSVWKGYCLCWSWWIRVTINIERINSQHFTVHINCQSPIINRGGGGLGGGWELCRPTISVTTRGCN